MTAGPAVRIATAGDAEACVAALAALPGYFAASTHDELRAELATDRTWVACDGATVVGFLAARVCFPGSAEVVFAAVRPEWQGRGAGTALLRAAFLALAADGVRVVLVRTLDASSGYEPYAAARAFWTRRGFVQVATVDPHPGWEPGNPAAFYVAPLIDHVPAVET